MDDDAAAAPSGGETATACASPNGDVQVQPAAPPAEEIVAHDEGSDLARRVGEGLLLGVPGAGGGGAALSCSHNMP